MFATEPHYYHDHPAQLDIEDLIKSLDKKTNSEKQNHRKRKQKDQKH